MKNAIWLFIIAVFVLFVFLPSYSRMQDLKDKNTEYQQRIQLLEKQQAQLQKEINRLEDDPMYLEKVARESMGLIREGEVVYQIEETPAVEE